MPKQNYLKKTKTIELSAATLFFLTWGLWIIGLVFIFGGFILLNRIYPQNIPDHYLGFVMAIGLPWFILGCVFVILRKEVPRLGSLPSIKGYFAIIQGVIGLITIGGVEIYLIYLLIFVK